MLNKKVAKTFAFSVSVVCGLVVSGLFASSAHACVFDDVDHSVYTNPSSSYLSSLDSFDNLYSGKKASVELLNMGDYTTGGDYTSLPSYDFTFDGVNLDTYANPGNTNIDDDIRLDEVNAYDTISSDSEIENELLEKHKELAEAKLNAKIALPVPGSQHN
ncbi:hypothetical protein ACLD5N_02630 [Gardnerella leopoldii]|uniref:hypothetical protein n=1 Tax=Gardnerella leopoldii TaxID=2792978 RepID=UPI003970622A